MRFKDFEYSSVPGPGLYKLKGFADEAVEKATKFNSVVNNSPYKQKMEAKAQQNINGNEGIDGINKIDEFDENACENDS